jgi:type II secretory pathway component PulK
MAAADVERLLSEREEAGFADIDTSFSQWPAVIAQIADASEFFQLKVIVRVDTVRITYFSLLERGPRGDVAPILRSLGTT